MIHENPFLYHEIGMCYFNKSNISKKKSIEYFEASLLKSIPKDTIVKTFFLGKAYHFVGEHEKAKKLLEHFKEKIKKSYSGFILSEVMNREIKTCINALFFEENKAAPHIVTNLGTQFNTDKAEFNPIVDSNMTILIYT
ncbi:MAG: hypothetical protein HRT71_17730 [Flavobacteriales bacterium]|nr:hypothetical protein [Flavobacteriales bacterium]